MSAAPDSPYYDFGPLVTTPTDILLHELATAHSNIANLCIRIGFLRQEEIRGVAHAKEQRLDYEAKREAEIEKKWLIVKVLEYGDEA